MKDHAGASNPNSKLNDEQVRNIRNSRKSVRELAELYKVSKITIYKILSGERWKGV